MPGRSPIEVFLRLVCVIGSSCTLCANAPLAVSDFLATKGTLICREAGRGEAVLLRGTNIGGWLMHESWMSPIAVCPLARDGWTVQATGGGGAAVLDGDVSSVWLSAQDRAVLTLRTPGPRTFERLRLRLGSSAVVPAGLGLETSLGGAPWQIRGFELDSSGAEIVLRLKEGVTVDTLRLLVPAGFSLAELDLLQGDDHTIRATLERRFGWERSARLIRAYHRIWFNEQDLDELAQMRLNLLRVPMNWLDFADERGALRKEAFRTLDWLVSECGRRGIYVLLDMHAVPGGADPWDSSGHAGNDGTGYNPNGFWSDPAKLELLARIWAEIAHHYCGNPAVAGYDLVNEPLLSLDESLPARLGATAARKGDMYDRLYRAVRAEDPGHIIVIGAFSVPAASSVPGQGSFSGFLAVPPPSVHGWTNVVYQTHHYDMAHPEDESAQRRLVLEALADLRARREAWQVPVYAGEYCLYQFPDVWRSWMVGLGEAGIAWTSWTYKVRGVEPSKGGGNWGFFNDNPAPVPDLEHDSEEEILRKWEAFASPRFHRNQPFINLVTEASLEAARRFHQATR